MVNILENIAVQYSNTSMNDKQVRLQVWQSIGDNISHLLHSFCSELPADSEYGIQPPYLPLTAESARLINNKIKRYEHRLQVPSVNFKKIEAHKYLVITGKAMHKDNLFACEFLFKVGYKLGLVYFTLKTNK